MRKRAALLVLALGLPSLQGCIPVIVGGAAGGALMAADRRTSGTIVEDEAIELKVTRAINLEYRDTSHVNVTAFNRAVLLTGEAQNETIKAAVEKLAHVENVKSVMNEVAIAGNSSLTSRSSDALITSKVKTRFLSENRFQANHVKVVTEAGIVYLMGMVTPQEGADAADIASNTAGVLKVVKAFEYMDKEAAKAPAASAAK